MINIDGLKNTILKLQIEPENLIFKKNLMALKEKDLDLYQKIINTKVSDEYLVIREQNNELKNLVSFSKNVVLYDVNNPLKSVVNEVDNLKLINSRIAVFLGIGLGYEVMYFIEEYSKKQLTEFILIIEKNIDIFIKALGASDLTKIINNPRVKFVVDYNEENLFVAFQEYLLEANKFMLVKATKFIYNLVNFNIYKDYYLNAIRKFNEAAAYSIDFYGNDPEDSIIGIENMLENIDVIINNPGINLLFEKFKDKPAVIVATGPSLNKNKHLLKGLENKALIVSADASLNILSEMGVKPHLVTSLERVPEVIELMGGFKKEEVDNVYYSACPVIQNSVYKAYPGPKIMVYRDYAQFKWIGIDRGILDVKQSSGNMAFKIAAALGCNPIILIGQDLAFDRDGLTHAKGTTFGDKQENFLQGGNLTVKANDGGVIETSKIWHGFLKGYEVDVAQYRGKCINSTEGGAYIEGTEVMPFKEAITKYLKEEYYPLNIIKNNLKEFNKENIKNDYNKVYSIINNTIKDMNLIIEKCNKGYEVCDKYENELNKYLSKEKKINIKKIENIEKEIVKYKNEVIFNNITFKSFFIHIFQSCEIKFQMDLYDLANRYEDLNMVKVASILKYKNWYAKAITIGQISLKVVEQAKQRLDEKECSI